MNMTAALKIAASVSGQQAIDQLNKGLQNVDGAANSLTKGFGFAKTALTGFLAIEAVQSLVGFAKSTIDAVDALQDMSNRTGVAVSALSELDFAAKMSGSSIEAVQSALGKLSVKAVDSVTGNKTAAAAFDALGISVLNADGTMRSSIDLMEDLGDKFRDIKDPVVKSALAIEIFGKSGAQMIPVIEGMREARAEAQALGVVVSDEFAAKAAAFNDNLDRMGAMSSALAKSLLNELLPSLNRVMGAMVQAQKAGEGKGWAVLRQVTREAVYDYENLDKSITDVTTKIARLEEMQAALTKDSYAAAFNRFFSPEDLVTVNNQLAEARAVLAQMAALRGPIAGAGRGAVNPSAPDNGPSALDRINGAKAAEEAAKTAKKLDGERLAVLKGLSDEITKLVSGEDELTLAKLRGLGASAEQVAKAAELIRRRNELSVADKAREKASSDANSRENERAGILKGLNEEITKLKFGEDGLLALRLRGLGASDQEIAAAVELMRQRAGLKDVEKEREEALKAAKKATDDATAAQEKLAEAGKRVFDDTRTPLEKYNAEMERLKGLLDANAISMDTFGRASKQADNELKGLGKNGATTMDELKNAVDGWGKDASAAFVEFAFTGKSSFGDMVTSILKDMAKMIIQTQIMAPLMAALKGMMGFTASANGNVMTDSGPMALKKYANGGIARTPQLSLFGEGSMAEAYVPLPDGRSIPVTVSGDGGGGGDVYNITVPVTVDGQGGAATSASSAGALGKAIANAVRSELINQKRPGGLLAA
jgi:hypothetical protein